MLFLLDLVIQQALGKCETGGEHSSSGKPPSSSASPISTTPRLTGIDWNPQNASTPPAPSPRGSLSTPGTFGKLDIAGLPDCTNLSWLVRSYFRPILIGISNQVFQINGKLIRKSIHNFLYGGY